MASEMGVRSIQASLLQVCIQNHEALEGGLWDSYKFVLRQLLSWDLSESSDHQPGRDSAAPRLTETLRSGLRGSPGRRLGSPGLQGRQHPPGLRFNPAVVPDVGRRRRPTGTATIPEAVALYLGHLAAVDRSMGSIKQSRAAISHFHKATICPSVVVVVNYYEEL